jgi:hypothetical protein
MPLARIPRFGSFEFAKEEEALQFLRKFRFRKIVSRSDYSVWETRTKPKVRANMHHDKRKVWVVTRL